MYLLDLNNATPTSIIVCSFDFPLLCVLLVVVLSFAFYSLQAREKRLLINSTHLLFCFDIYFDLIDIHFARNHFSFYWFFTFRSKMNASVSKSKSGQRPKKRKFRGNKYVKVIKEESGKQHIVNRKVVPNASSKKLSLGKEKLESNLSNADSDFVGYRLIDMKLFLDKVTSLSCCALCHGQYNVVEKLTRGLASTFEFKCQKCKTVDSFSSCQKIGAKMNASDVNLRSVLAMRSIGKGLKDLQMFCTMMNLPCPVEQKTYDNINFKLCSVVCEVAKESMANAAAEEKQSAGQNTITVSGDGTWKTRGHTSLIGACTLIGAETGKVLDIEVMSSYCKVCDSYKGVKFGLKYKRWLQKHMPFCKKNHSGSAGKMEVDGMLKIFQRSETLHGAKYTNYIGDGDSKTFLALSKKNPYGDNYPIQKEECVGHVQKRMGSRLRKLKVSSGKRKLSDGKTIGGKGRLTDCLIQKLTIYYGNAIRQHKNSVASMRQAIWAVWGHTFSTDEEPMHWFCPKDKNTWCKYNAAANKGETSKYKHKNVIAKSIKDEVKPIFAELCKTELLKRCLGGKTQNPNESINSIIWKYCPKTIGCGLKVAEIAANLATCVFNDGHQSFGTILHKLDLKIDKDLCVNLKNIDQRRITAAEKKASAASFEARRAKRMKLMVENEKHLKDEGVVYAKGEF